MTVLYARYHEPNFYNLKHINTGKFFFQLIQLTEMQKRDLHV